MKRRIVIAGVALMLLAPVMWIGALWTHALIGISHEVGSAAALTGLILLTIGAIVFTAGVDRPADRLERVGEQLETVRRELDRRLKAEAEKAYQEKEATR